MKLPKTAILLAWSLAACASASVGSSNPLIVQTHCDTLSLDPLRVHIEFRVENADPSVPVCSMILAPLPGGNPPGPCQVLQCGSPPLWKCVLRPYDGAVLWDAADLNPSGDVDCIAVGGTRESFSIVVGQTSCCYSIGYWTGGILEPFYESTVCFEWQDPPVPARSATWGQLKAIYR